MLTFANLPLFLEAEAIATACFTQNRLIIHKRFDKTPYELMNKRKPNIKFFRVFGCRCYLLNDYEDVGKLKEKGILECLLDIQKKMASKQFSLEPGLYNLNETRKSSNPLVSQVLETSKKVLEDLFQKFYDEYFDSSKIMKSSTTNVETSINKEVFHEVSESFQEESSSSSLNDDVQQRFHRLSNGCKDIIFNGTLKEEVYVGQPPGFVSKQYPDHVYALDKALYGLKQALQAWYDVLSQFLIDSGFQKGSIDTTLFIKKKVLTPMVEQAKLKLDLVGKPVDHTDYRSMIGSLMYVTSSRPDIMFATCICAKYQANSNEHHVSAVKRIFSYLKRTINLGFWYPKDSGFDLTAYLDAGHARCHLDRKKSEYFAVSSCCAQVLWMRTQLTDYGFFYDKNCVSISTAESKYFAVSSCCAQVLWMRTQLTDYGFFYDKVPIYCDSKSAIAISCNL
nr:hypothetical protein [Tanacetum cinerariifolium]